MQEFSVWVVTDHQFKEQKHHFVIYSKSSLSIISRFLALSEITYDETAFAIGSLI